MCRIRVSSILLCEYSIVSAEPKQNQLLKTSHLYLMP